MIATDPELIAQNAERRLVEGTIERTGGEAIIRLQSRAMTRKGHVLGGRGLTAIRQQY